MLANPNPRKWDPLLSNDYNGVLTLGLGLPKPVVVNHLEQKHVLGGNVPLMLGSLHIS